MPPSDFDQPLVPAPIVTTPQPPPPGTHVFFGPLGVRAGWGILIFFVLAAILGTLLVFGALHASGHASDLQARAAQHHQEALAAKAAHKAPPIHPELLTFVFLTEAPQTAAVLLVALLLSVLERRRFGVYGLRLPHIRDALPGAVCGIAALSLLIGLLRAFHLIAFDSRILHGAAIVRYGLGWLAFFLVVGIFEEFLFRGYILFTLMRGLLGLARRFAPSHERLAAFWMSAILCSLLFFVAHTGNTGENHAGLLMVFCAGILFSYALWRTGSLWWAIGFHTTWDWAQSFLYGVPDSGTLSHGRLFLTHPVGRVWLSGGVDGPEGSILILPVLLLVFLLLRLHPQATQPPLEPESLPSFMHNAPPEAIP